MVNLVVLIQSFQGEKLWACEYVCSDNHKIDRDCFYQRVSSLLQVRQQYVVLSDMLIS